MPQDPPDNHGVDPNEQPTQPLPQAQPDQQAPVAADATTPGGADAPTMPFEPVPASTEPIAPYVPIADLSADDEVRGSGAGAPPPPAKTDRKSPVPWILGAAVLILAAAIALALLRPWENGDPVPVVSPTPSVSITPTPPPTEEPTEEPTTEPSPTEEPAPPPEPTPEPTLEPTPTQSPTPTPTEPNPAIPPA